MLIDDFASGVRTVTLNSGADANYQSIATNPNFPVRSTWFFIANPPSNQPGTLDIGSPERLNIGTGPNVYHRLQVTYGFDLSGSLQPLGCDLSLFKGFRVNFDFNDLTLNFNLVFYSKSGSTHSQQGLNIVSSLVPFSVDFPFSEFKGNANASEVDVISLIAQTGSFGEGNDYKINSVEVYSE